MGSFYFKNYFQHSYKELLLLIFLILVSGIIFASLAYFIEIEEVCSVLLERSSNPPQRISIISNDRVLVSRQFRLPSTGSWSRWPLSDTETSTPRRLLARFDNRGHPLLLGLKHCVSQLVGSLCLKTKNNIWAVSQTKTISQLVGSLCAVAGVLVLSLPIPIIAQVSFNSLLCKRDSLTNPSLVLEFWGIPHGDEQEEQVKTKHV